MPGSPTRAEPRPSTTLHATAWQPGPGERLVLGTQVAHGPGMRADGWRLLLALSTAEAILEKKRHENVHEDIYRRAFVFVRGKNKNHLNTHQLGTGLISHSASTCWSDCKPHKDRADICSFNTTH